MRTNEIVTQAVENLQRVIAQTLKEDIPERSKNTAGMYYVANDALMYVTESGKSVSISISCHYGDLLKEAARLHEYELTLRREELYRQIKEINKELGEGAK